MDDKQLREGFDTGLSKIRHEIKSRLVQHGLFGTVTSVDTGTAESYLTGTTLSLIVKGRTFDRTFDREQIEACQLRVGGAVLVGIISMVEEAAA